MNWLFLTLMTAFFYGTYNFFIKVSSGYIHQILGAVILQFTAAIFGGIILLYLYFSNTTLLISQKGVNYAILAGVSVGLAEILSFYVFSKNIDLTIAMPIIVAGSIIFGLLLSIYFLQESLGISQIIAILLILIGTFILTTK